MTEVTLKYEPREPFKALHARTKRWACMVVHRRGGKTVACINELITRALYTGKENARYAYIAPFYRQAKDVAWQYLKDFGEGVIVKTRESELRVELVNGSWITLYGADNPDALRGLYLDGVVLDEYGDCRPSLWGQVVLPCLADRKGWAIFIGTPKGKNHFYEINKRSKEDEKWYHLTLKASESGILDPEELGEMKAQMAPEEFEQEMECNFEAAVKGTYYSHLVNQKELNGTIGDNVGIYDPRLPVNASTDLGYTDSCAWWFWQEPPDKPPQVILYYENDSKHLDHYIDYLRATGYTYDTIWLPHDAKAKTLQTKRSTIEQLAEEDFPVMIVPRLSKQHGIDAGRMILSKVHINATMCYEGIEALRAYRRKYNELTKSFSETPLHDWSSHGADAWRYLSLVLNEQEIEEEEVKPTTIELAAPQFTLNQLFADREQRQNRFKKLRI